VGAARNQRIQGPCGKKAHSLHSHLHGNSLPCGTSIARTLPSETRNSRYFVMRDRTRRRSLTASTNHAFVFVRARPALLSRWVFFFQFQRPVLPDR
jgi:hypothetical protein